MSPFLETWQPILPVFAVLGLLGVSSSSESESILKSTRDGASSLFFSSEIRLPLLTRSITEEMCFLILVVSFASSKVIGVAPWFKEFYRIGHVLPLTFSFVFDKVNSPKVRDQTLPVYKILYLDFLCQLLPRMSVVKMSMQHPYFLANLKHRIIKKLYRKRNYEVQILGAQGQPLYSK